jgi:hypothetical protein
VAVDVLRLAITEFRDEGTESEKESWYVFLPLRESSSNLMFKTVEGTNWRSKKDLLR